jgi:hypothetical protein
MIQVTTLSRRDDQSYGQWSSLAWPLSSPLLLFLLAWPLSTPASLLFFFLLAL